MSIENAKERSERAHSEERDVAVIAMNCTFPGATSIYKYWNNIKNGVESITQFSRDELLKSGIPESVIDNARYVPARGVIEGIEYFDAEFFGYSPSEAEVMDPQHRVFMEHAWQALETAGYYSDGFKGQIGIFAGSGHNSYMLTNLWPHRSLSGHAPMLEIAIGNDKDHLATRVAYKLNLRGPALSIQTTCSTSLVAISVAVRNLLAGDCDIALAGGVSVSVPAARGYMCHQGGILSPDGHCRTFDASAKGTVFGNGVGVVVLKRLSDALADRDTILSVIKGVAINNDGAVKVGYTAPSIDGQAKVIAKAQAAAGVSPESIGYVEAHGTGTQLGDPIEVTALTEAFRLKTDKKQFCAIGSVKSNLGHLNGAAGVAGFIKTVMAVREGKVPPSLHFENPNPQINFADSPFYVNTKLTDWPKNAEKRLAGISSFGIGGTNAHVVIQEPPTQVSSAASKRPWSILPISARTETALTKAVENMMLHLTTDAKNQSLADIAYTLQVGRKAFSNRLAVISNDKESVALTLQDAIGSGTRVQAGQRRVAFVFPGQGSQMVGATSHIYRQERVFRESMDQCCNLFAELIGVDLRDLLYAEKDKQAESQEKLNETGMAQPAIFSICYSLAKLWMSWGISPTDMLGHSIGEYVAACISGIFSLNDVIAIVAARSRLMQSLPHGSMISVAVTSSECERLITQSKLPLDLALVNGENSCVVSGERDVVTSFQEFLATAGIESNRLRTSHAFHSRMMSPILQEFKDAFAKVSFNKPSIPVVSNVTGTWMMDEDAVDPDYWARHLRHAVQFDTGIQTLLEGGCDIVLEVGAGQSMSALVKQHRALAADQVVLSSLPHAREVENESFVLANCVASLWRAGASLDWQAYNRDEALGRIPLPTYPFERQRFWIEPKTGNDQPKSIAPVRAALADSFYTLNWKRLNPLKRSISDDLKKSPKTWLILADQLGVASSLGQRLSELGHKPIIVDRADTYQKLDHLSYQINPGNSEDYKNLLEDLHRNQLVPDHVMHMWGITPGQDSPVSDDAPEISSFFSMLWLMQAISSQASLTPLHVCIAATGMYEVDGRDKVDTIKSMLAGPRSVIPLEFANVSCRIVDIQLPASDTESGEAADRLLKEVGAWSAESTVALRDNHRWAYSLEKATLEMPMGGSTLRKQGVYLITGGTSGIGLVLAEHLARTQQARLILTGRRVVPPRDQWQQSIDDPSTEKSTSYLLQKVMEMELAGAEVELRSADVCDRVGLAGLVDGIYAQWGVLNGVIHSAGVPGGGIIALKSRDEVERVLAPKVTGTNNLLDILKGRTLDFIALCSSVDAIRGVDGQIDYAAANAYLDAVARLSATSSTTRVVAINWPTWREVGMSVSVEVPEAMKARRHELLKLALTNAEGVEAFERILASPYEQVIVAPTEIHVPKTKRLDSLNQEVIKSVPADIKKPTRTLHPRPQLATPYVAPENEIEEQLAGIWQDLFGIERIGTKDNFFALGGHSLMAVRLTFRVREHFQVEFPLQDLFKAPTISETAELIMLKYAGELDPNELAHLLNDIESLSPEELRNTLALQ